MPAPAAPRLRRPSPRLRRADARLLQHPACGPLDSVDQMDLTAKTPRKVTNRGEGPV